MQVELIDYNHTQWIFIGLWSYLDWIHFITIQNFKSFYAGCFRSFTLILHHWRMIMMQVLPLIQDSFGRLSDRSKETPKAMKQLSRLFPNKVTVQLPQVLFMHSVHNLDKLFYSPSLSCLSLHFWASWQDEALLVDWKQQLERDIETLKVQANIASVRSVSVISSVSWPVTSSFIMIFLLSTWQLLVLKWLPLVYAW